MLPQARCVTSHANMRTLERQRPTAAWQLHKGMLCMGGPHKNWRKGSELTDICQLTTALHRCLRPCCEILDKLEAYLSICVSVPAARKDLQRQGRGGGPM
jgi:hypothetical protein